MVVGNASQELRELVVGIELGRAGLKDRRFCHGWKITIYLFISIADELK